MINNNRVILKLMIGSLIKLDKSSDVAARIIDLAYFSMPGIISYKSFEKFSKKVTQNNQLGLGVLLSVNDDYTCNILWSKKPNQIYWDDNQGKFDISAITLA